MKRNLLLFIFSITTVTLSAQWNGNPSVNNVLVKTPYTQSLPVPVSDGAGGSIVIFTSQNGFDVYAQRITAAGTIAWGDSTQPVVICNAAGDQEEPLAIADGNGGAFIAWDDYRFSNDYSEMYIQHINAAGTVLWTANGVRVTNSAAEDDYGPMLCADGAGGVYLSWLRDNYLDNFQCMVQRFSSAGAAQWAANGIQACTAPGFRYSGALVADGSNGVIIFLNDTRNDPHGLDYDYVDSTYLTNTDLYAQRIDISGNRLWTNNGAAVSTFAGNQGEYQFESAVSDGSGGAIIAFDDSRNFTAITGRHDIYVQRINTAGLQQWATNGIPISTTPGERFLGSITTDGNNGIAVSWKDPVNDELRAQKISSSGTLAWGGNGVAIAPISVHAYDPFLTADGAGNFICPYLQYDSLGNTTIKAQKINAAGSLQWAPGGINVCNNPNSIPGSAQAVLSTTGSIIAVWSDYRNHVTTESDIYCSRILSDGSLAGSVPGFTTIANGNWNDPSIWAGGVVPSAGSVVVINNAVTVTANAVCYSLTLIPPGSVTVNTGVTLTILH